MNIFELARWSEPEFVADTVSFFRQGAALTRSRMLLQNLNSVRKLPLGGKEIFIEFQTFFQQCEEGFVISQRRDPQNFSKIMAEFEAYRPVSEGDVVKELASINLNWKSDRIEVNAVSDNLMAYMLTAATLGYLRQQRSVSFTLFPKKPDALMLGPVEETLSYWHLAPSPDAVWAMITGLHKQTEAAIAQAESLPVSDLLPVSHFFTAGMNLALELASRNP